MAREGTPPAREGTSLMTRVCLIETDRPQVSFSPSNDHEATGPGVDMHAIFWIRKNLRSKDTDNILYKSDCKRISFHCFFTDLLQYHALRFQVLK